MGHSGTLMMKVRPREVHGLGIFQALRIVRRRKKTDAKEK
jgi:hypothetical protein